MSEYQIVYANGYELADRLNLLLSLAANDLGLPLLERVMQGSYNAGGVSVSAGTHDAGGAVDLSVTGLSPDVIWRVLTVLRQRGLVAWHRTPAQGPWAAHIHGIDRGANDLSPGAAEQVRLFDQGYNGLVGNRPDDGPRVPVEAFVYADGLAEWDRITREDDMTQEQFDKLVEAVASRVNGILGDYTASGTPRPNAGDKPERADVRLRQVEAKLDKVLAALSKRP